MSINYADVVSHMLLITFVSIIAQSYSYLSFYAHMHNMDLPLTFELPVVLQLSMTFCGSVLQDKTKRMGSSKKTVSFSSMPAEKKISNGEF